MLFRREVWRAVHQMWNKRSSKDKQDEGDNTNNEELLNENQIELPLTTSQPPLDVPPSRRVRALSLTVGGSFTEAHTRRRASLQPDQLKPLRDQFSLASVVAAATAANAATWTSSSKDKQDGRDNTNNKGMLGITEEGTISEESGEETTNQNRPLVPPSTATNTTTLTTTTTSNSTTPEPPISQSLSGTELERRPSQDSIASSVSQEGEARFAPPSSTFASNRKDSSSAQNTGSGGRYIKTILLAILVEAINRLGLEATRVEQERITEEAKEEQHSLVLEKMKQQIRQLQHQLEESESRARLVRHQLTQCHALKTQQRESVGRTVTRLMHLQQEANEAQAWTKKADEVAAAGHKKMNAWNKMAHQGLKKTLQQVALEEAHARVAALRGQAESRHGVHAKVAKLRLQVQQLRKVNIWLEQEAIEHNKKLAGMETEVERVNQDIRLYQKRELSHLTRLRLDKEKVSANNARLAAELSQLEKEVTHMKDALEGHHND
ncbi:hypothetical protein Pmani_030037 [Petrolisthes manimaculis]|uniref:Uncharacterized protein n=1 Tax=Petrolisthes manimaculis TaxID=1843537 RepID=A0AAE1NWD3_9EUCA|nr:hypothetical protein Pmani_030037 [Petrolisthes manimaculis]